MGSGEGKENGGGARVHPHDLWLRLLLGLAWIPVTAWAINWSAGRPVLPAAWAAWSLPAAFVLAVHGIAYGIAFRRRLEGLAQPSPQLLMRRLAVGSALAELPAFAGLAGAIGGRPLWEFPVAMVLAVGLFLLVRPPR